MLKQPTISLALSSLIFVFSSTGMAQSSAPARPTAGAVIVLRPYGFVPSEVKAPAGRVRLIVYNRSSLDQITLRLDRVAGARLHEVTLGRGKGDWRESVELAAGSYLLTEAGRPQWVCRVTVTPAGNPGN